MTISHGSGVREVPKSIVARGLCDAVDCGLRNEVLGAQLQLGENAAKRAFGVALLKLIPPKSELGLLLTSFGLVKCSGTTQFTARASPSAPVQPRSE